MQGFYHANDVHEMCLKSSGKNCFPGLEQLSKNKNLICFLRQGLTLLPGLTCNPGQLWTGGSPSPSAFVVLWLQTVTKVCSVP